MEKFYGVISDLIEFTYFFWRGVFNLSHFIGCVVVTLLFVLSLLLLSHIVAAAFGYPTVFLGLYEKVGSIYKDPVAWAATSMVIGTTVAIGHMRNLEINENKSQNDSEDRWKEKQKEQEENKLKTKAWSENVLNGKRQSK